jgi:predicted nucleic acid-binding protein
VIVVADTSPINFLCQIGRIELLRVLFDEIVIPSAVAAELSQPATPAVSRNFIANLPAWVHCRAPQSIVPMLPQLGAGETEAICLAREIDADLIIIDDKAARTAAAQRGLSVIGTLGVLQLAASRQLVAMPEAVTDLKACGFYMTDRLIEELLKASCSPPPAG